MHRYMQKSTYYNDRDDEDGSSSIHSVTSRRKINWFWICDKSKDCCSFIWEKLCCCLPDSDANRSAIKKEDITYILQNTDGENSETQSQGERHGSFADSTRASISSYSSGARDLKTDLYNQIEARRASSGARETPVIDLKSIQVDFWSGGNSRDSLQLVQPPSKHLNPNSSGRRDTMFSISSQSSADQIQPHLYTNEHLQREGIVGEEMMGTTEGGSGESGGSGANGGNLGSITFFLSYDVISKTLLVKIIEACDLPRPLLMDSTKQDQAHSNPYVKILLLPNMKDSRQTTLRKKTQNPRYDESFSFEIAFMELHKKNLQLIVKDFDKYSRHREIGQCIAPFSEINVVKGVRLTRPLKPVINKSTVTHEEDLGEILFSLCYLPAAGRLNIDILKAKQLLPTDLECSAPYVRVSLVIGERHVKTKKTSYKKYTLEPIFNESLSFDVNVVQLSETSVVLTVMDFNGGIVKDKDNFIGRIVLGREASGQSEATHWKNTTQSQRTAFTQWHTLKSKPHCQINCPNISKLLS